ncbi:tyrosine/phenylalanine carboxypeptidase domain-containing protein [Acidipropionibacterium acidipropionici]|uniref:tyrosine/phenylalanine carboxypeptidase domain-containing protein n=1 Tax=Acidipropionibacterium acidipropionici TaxID=1748 RepID=UPI00110BDA35|nr:tyrosine/phenylalanine carboxypeptidase domain-containing protein [Acidipropionibacterium acidipropionici]QCV96501.1 DUF1704 domain-containing protein [Acidipropionibacterium acidipropionici]
MDSRELLTQYRAITDRISTDPWTQPRDLADHRRALSEIDLDAETYPDSFSYNYNADDPSALDHLLAAFRQQVQSSTGMGPVADLILDEIDRQHLLVTGVQAHNDAEFARVQRLLHPLPTDDTIAHARETLATTSPAPAYSDASVTGEQLAHRMETALAAYDLSAWYVEIRPDMAAKASVNGPKHRVRVRAGQHFSTTAADRLLAHEVGGHVLRWANSARQVEPWAQVSMGSTVATEEGLAVCREIELGCLDTATVRTYAARCIAVSIAATGGIMDVMRAIAPHVGRQEAAEIAIRTKRGLQDPNAPGGATKDGGYYAGLLTLDALRLSDPRDYQLLGSVKWPYAQLPLVRKLFEQERISLPELKPEEVKLGLDRPAVSSNLGTGLLPSKA